MKINHTAVGVHAPVAVWQRILYTMPLCALVPLIAPILIVQGIYAKHYEISLTVIASVILFVRVFDALTDPIIGFLADRDRLKSGTRKPYMTIGALLTIGSGYCLYTPPDNVGITYFAIWFTLVYLGFTLFGVSHMAWGSEISHDCHEKTQTYNLRTAASYAGVIIFYSTPLLPMWETAEITPETLRFSASISVLFTLPLLYFCMKHVPNGNCYSGEMSEGSAVKVSTFSRSRVFTDTLNSIVSNRPLLLFLSAFVFSGVSLGMWYGLIFIFIDAYLNKGEIFAEINLIVFGIGVLSSFLWARLSRMIGKKLTWLAAMLLGIVAFVYTGFFHPENVNYLSILLLLAINIMCFICLEMIPLSMLSDIVDYATLKFRIYRGSTYFSLFMFIYKGASAVGAALGLAIAGWYGFDPSTTEHTDYEVSGLMMAMIWIPTLLALIAIVFISISPITSQRHQIIRRRLDRLEARSRQKKRQRNLNSEVLVSP